MTNVCFYHDGKAITVDNFLTDISIIREEIKPLSPNSFVLFNLDSYLFSVTLFALVLENRHVLLPPNGQIETLKNISEGDNTGIANFNVSKSLLTDDVKSDVLTPSFSQNITSINDLFVNFEGKITFFTSGSTSNAKPIEKNCRQLKLEAHCLIETFSTLLDHHVYAETRVLSTVSHQHIYGLLFKIIVPLTLGVSIESASFDYPEHILNYLNNIDSSKALLISSPAHLKRLVKDNVLTEEKGSLLGVFSSGGLLTTDVSYLFTKQMAMTPIEIYGSTETGGIAWRICPRGLSEPWQVFSNITFSINSDNLLNICSPYIDDKQYLTDDIIERISATQFHLLGRNDRTVKLEEKRINLTQLEQLLLKHLWITDVRVLLVDKNSRQYLCALIELNELANQQLVKLGKRVINNMFKQHLLAEFERICLPKKWRYIDGLPYNSQGKLNLKELEKMFE